MALFQQQSSEESTAACASAAQFLQTLLAWAYAHEQIFVHGQTGIYYALPIWRRFFPLVHPEPTMKFLPSTIALACFALICPALQAQNTLPQVEENALRAHLALLSSDLFEGRGTGQRGGDLTAAYLEAQVAALGLQAGNGKSFRQAVPIHGIQAQLAESTLQLQAGGQALGFKYGSDWVWNSKLPIAKQSFSNQFVFAGYGVTAPDENWDDFKGQDVRDKILLLLPNDPQPTASEPNRFGGKAMTYYARRGFKIEEALRRGAKGVFLIHNEALASISWKALAGNAESEHFQLAAQGIPVVGWLTEASARQLFAASGQDYDVLRAKAEQRDFVPQALSASLQGDLRSALRQIEQFNIAAVVPGTDEKLKSELVIYSAHWDHLGKVSAKPGESDKDLIFNGAVDNASGTAALLAMAKAAQKRPAKRSQMFLWVAAEEQGLLGSEYYANNPLWPLNKTAANLNLDSMNFVGLTKDISSFGAERSDLGEMAAKLATSMQLKLAAPRVDINGVYFRSDHFSFAKAGIPAFSVGGGSEYVANQEANAAKRAGFGQRYHQLNDEYDPTWDLSGMQLQAQFTLNLGRNIADAEQMPKWKAGDPFGLIRKPQTN